MSGSLDGREKASALSIDVSIVVPVYRNEDTLQELHRRLCQVLEDHQLGFELLFVDDACPAGSLNVLTSLARQDPRIAVLVFETNRGQHQAVLAGLSYARGRWTVVMDADLQDPPEAIPDLLAKGEEGFATVFAGRRGRYESSWRLLTSRIFKNLLHFLCGVPPDAGIFLAMNQRMQESLLAMKGPSPFIVAMIGCTGWLTTSIPVARASRPSGQSAYSSWGRLRSAWRAIAWVVAWKWRVLAFRKNSYEKHPVSQGRVRNVHSQVVRHIGARFQESFVE
jgi:polyisoprenyl-phosphate glycosyltransferase